MIRTLGFVALAAVLSACEGEPPCDSCGPAVEPPEHRDLTTGWDDPPGTGLVFVIDSFAIADFERGFDLDDRCRGPGDCVDNALWQVGQFGNDQIRQALLGGENLMLIEIAGIDDPFYGDDAHVTVKLYGARDADDPFFPANNFQIPAGDTKCCEFRIFANSIGPDGRAKARLPARIEGYAIHTKGAPRRLTFPGMPVMLLPALASSSTIGLDLEDLFASVELPLENAVLTAHLHPSLSATNDGLLGGAVPINSLAGVDSTACYPPAKSCSLLDFYASLLRPDIDLDGDGLETAELGPTGRIERCLDGGSRPLPPLDPKAPWSCAIRPEMVDGYSTAFTFHGVKATVVGVGQ